ncbi:MAG: CBS domain-containing protein [Desulfobacterales bacterium]|jgi:nanoRNase/pAp phosphatase (c-di-AMP/oligoRNAs hydrolase)|nr:CBS domain-containing protein [Desulfobacterales bacterium]
MRIVTTHKNTDFDALASTIAATIIYPDAVPVLPKVLNPNVKAFLALHKDLLRVKTVDEVDLDSVSSLIVVDTNNWDRLQVKKEAFENNNSEIILFDHHPYGGNIQANLCVQEEMGATITLMIRRLREERKLITPIQATLFLTGIYEDTGNLTFSSTMPEDAYSAGWLLERKADLKILASLLRPTYRQQQKDTLFEMLKTATRQKLNNFTVSFSKTEISGYVDSLSVVVHMYREVLNVDAAFGIFFDPERGSSMIIGRSNNDGINIGILMRSFGGGGHPGAGSAMLKAASPDAIEETIKELILGNQRTSIRISDLMSFPVMTVHEKMPMREVAQFLREKGVTGLPVVNDDEELVGVISRRDFKKVKKDPKLTAPVKAYMSHHTVTIEPEKSPAEAAGLMIKHDIGRLPVVENGRLIGIVTRTDTMHYFYDILPD